MMPRIISFLFFFFLISTGPVGGILAQPSIQLRMEANPREIAIGDIIQLNMTVIFSTGLSPTPISLPDPMGEFELVDYESTQPKKTRELKIHQEHRFSLTTFSTGTQVIPAIQLAFSDESGKVAETETQEIEIQVISLLEKYGDEGNLRPLKGFFNFRSYWWAWALLGLIVLVVFVWLGFRLFKKPAGGEKEQTTPPRPPQELIWEAIQHLEDSDLLSEEKAKDFYSHLSSALRQYLEGRFHISALDRTSSELMSEIRKEKFSPELTSLIREMTTNGDLVKFAKFTPKESEMEMDLERLKKFATLTAPKEKKEEKEKIPV